MSQPNFTITVNKDATSTFWNEPPKQASLADIKDLLSTPLIRDDKDGMCFIPGEFQGNRRSANAMMSIDMLVYDVDGHQTLNEALEKLTEAGVFALVYTTFSHRTNRTLIHTNHYDEWAKKNGLPSAATKENVLKYLASKKKDHLKNVEFDPSDHKCREFNAKGLHIVVHHDPLDKFRVVLPLASPIPVATLSYTTKQSIAEWKSIYHGVGQELGLAYDPACEDPSRVHYMPACSKSNEDKFDVFQLGDPNDPVLLDWTKYPRVKTADKRAARGEVRRAPRDATTVTDKNGVPIDLVAWERDHANLDIETCLETHLPGEDLKDPRAKGGFHITCPNEADHSEPGGLGCFAANGDEEYGWTINCRHAGCAGRNRLDHLRALVAQGVLTAADIGYAPPVMVADLTPESTPEEITAALETLARSKPGRVALDAKLDEIGQKLGKTQARFKANLAADYKTVEKRLAKSRKPEIEDVAVNPVQDRLDLINWAVSMTPDQMRAKVAERFCARNRDNPRVYRWGALPVRIVHDPDPKATSTRQTYDGYTFAAELEKHCVWGKTVKDVTVYEDCPATTANKLKNDPELDLPILRDVVAAPYYSPAGRLVTSAGYDAETEVYLDPPPGFEMDAIPDEPTRDDVEEALRAIVSVYYDFPFDDGPREPKGRASLANTLARDLTPFIREMVDNVPIFAINKPDNGVGATKLVDVGGLITLGRKVPASEIPPNDAEMGKFLLSQAMAGAKRVFLDNWTEGVPVEGAALAAAGTADRLEGRVLGKSEIGGGYVRWIVEVTGVGLAFSNEIQRRVIYINLDPQCARPSERSGWLYSDLEGFVAGHRPALVWAYLVLIQNWIAKGKPKYTGKPLASFESWCNVVGGVLEAAGVPCFNENRYLLAGEDSSAREVFAQKWLETFGERQTRVDPSEHFDQQPTTLADLYLSLDDSLVNLGVSRASHVAESIGGRLGKKLSPMSGRVFRLNVRGREAMTEEYRVTKGRDGAGVTYALKQMPGTRRVEFANPAERLSVEWSSAGYDGEDDGVAFDYTATVKAIYQATRGR